MFEVNNGVAKIDGIKGKYNEENVTNPSVRYGRNSVQCNSADFGFWYKSASGR